MTRERILMGGESGAGKTYSWLSVARCQPDAQFYVAEPDDGVKKVLELEYPDVVKQGNVHGVDKSPNSESWNGPQFIRQWRDFRHYINGLRKLESSLKDTDWIVVEGLDIITQIIRYEYLEQTNKVVKTESGAKEVMEDVWDAILTKRARGAPVLEPSDHDAINYEYERQLAYLAYSVPSNFMATTGIAAIDFKSQFVDKSVKEFYAALGMPFKFEGHKRNPRMFDTLIYLFPPGDPRGTYQVEVVKDRGIGRQERIKNTEFWLALEQSRAKRLTVKQMNG